MPDKLDDENKNTKLDKIYQSAERSGLKDVFDKSLESKRTDLASLRVGEATFDDDTELSEQELSHEIGQAVAVDQDFCKDQMDLDPENTPRSGDKEQVLLESAVKRDKIVQLDKDHRLEVVSAE